MSSIEQRQGVYRVDVRSALAPAFSHWLRIVLVTVLAVGLVYGLLLFVPRTYEATATLVAEPQPGAVGPSAGSLDYLTASQLGLISSSETLTAEIDSQHLREIPEFSDPDASPVSALLGLIGIEPPAATVDATVLARLRDRLDVASSRGSGNITITVRSTNAGQAAAIANAIAA
jgi:uncharacterized protein involved in exopolysaccharide biosynthesis